MQNLMSIILNISVQTVVIVLIAVVLRALFRLMKLPKRYNIFLWLVVFVFMVCPWRLEVKKGFWGNTSFEKIISMNEYVHGVNSDSYDYSSPIENAVSSDTLVPSYNSELPDYSGLINNPGYTQDMSDAWHGQLALTGEEDINGTVSNSANNTANNTSDVVIWTNEDKVNSADKLNSADKVNNADEFDLTDNLSEINITDSKDTETNIISIVRLLFAIWICGIAVFLVATLISFVKLKNKLRPAIQLKNNIYICDEVTAPMVLGLIKPLIYLPSGLDEYAMERVMKYVVAHEETHILRHHSAYKLFAHLIACVYWFNPMVWLAYRLFSEDMEMSCDEETVEKIGGEYRHEYAETLLYFSRASRHFFVAPVSFSEEDTKKRVKNIVGYKKAAGIIGAVAVVCIIIFAIVMSTKTGNVKSKDLNSQSDNNQFANGQLESNQSESNQLGNDQFESNSSENNQSVNPPDSEENTVSETVVTSEKVETNGNGNYANLSGYGEPDLFRLHFYNPEWYADRFNPDSINVNTLMDYGIDISSLQDQTISVIENIPRYYIENAQDVDFADTFYIRIVDLYSADTFLGNRLEIYRNDGNVELPVYFLPMINGKQILDIDKVECLDIHGDGRKEILITTDYKMIGDNSGSVYKDLYIYSPLYGGLCKLPEYGNSFEKYELGFENGFRYLSILCNPSNADTDKVTELKLYYKYGLAYEENTEEQKIFEVARKYLASNLIFDTKMFINDLSNYSGYMKYDIKDVNTNERFVDVGPTSWIYLTPDSECFSLSEVKEQGYYYAIDLIFTKNRVAPFSEDSKYYYVYLEAAMNNMPYGIARYCFAVRITVAFDENAGKYEVVDKPYFIAPEYDTNVTSFFGSNFSKTLTELSENLAFDWSGEDKFGRKYGLITDYDYQKKEWYPIIYINGCDALYVHKTDENYILYYGNKLPVDWPYEMVDAVDCGSRFDSVDINGDQYKELLAHFYNGTSDVVFVYDLHNKKDLSPLMCEAADSSELILKDEYTRAIKKALEELGYPYEIVDGFIYKNNIKSYIELNDDGEFTGFYVIDKGSDTVGSEENLGYKLYFTIADKGLAFDHVTLNKKNAFTPYDADIRNEESYDGMSEFGEQIDLINVEKLNFVPVSSDINKLMSGVDLSAQTANSFTDMASCDVNHDGKKDYILLYRGYHKFDISMLLSDGDGYKAITLADNKSDFFKLDLSAGYLDDFKVHIVSDSLGIDCETFMPKRITSMLAKSDQIFSEDGVVVNDKRKFKVFASQPVDFECYMIEDELYFNYVFEFGMTISEYVGIQAVCTYKWEDAVNPIHVSLRKQDN